MIKCALHQLLRLPSWGFGGEVVAAHLPFTSKVADSNLNENFSMRLEPSSYVKRVKVNALPKVVGFLRVYSGFLPQGKLTGWVKHIGQGADH
jgi:hypothetical protein